MSDDDGPLILPPSPGPVAAAQAAFVVLHLADGLGMLLFAHLAPVEALGPTLSTLRVWGGGVAVLATVVCCAVSTFLTVAVFRTVRVFRKLPPGRARALLAVGTVVANSVGCLAALMAVGLWITSTLVGDVHLMNAKP